MSTPSREDETAPIWLNGAAVHPSLPILATTANSDEGQDGRVTLWDVARGVPLFSIDTEYVGPFEPTERHVVRWAREGLRLATPCSTSGVMLIQDGRIFGDFYPDDGRDHNVEFCWVNTSLYSPVGSGVLVTLEEGDSLFARDLQFFETDDAQYPYELRGVEFNPTLHAIVGFNTTGITAIDPHTQHVIYRVPQPCLGRATTISPDGRWLLRDERDDVTVPTLILHDLCNGATPAHRIVLPSSMRGDWILRRCWGPAGWIGALIGSLPPRADKPASLAMIRHGRIVHMLPFPRTVHCAPDVNGSELFAWAPDGSRVALLFDQTIQIYELDTQPARLTHTLRLPALPEPPSHPDWMKPEQAVTGLIWAAPDRLFVLGTYTLRVLSTSGELVASHLVRDVPPGER